MNPYGTMALTEVTKLPGVSDLKPLTCKAKFAQALRAEGQGEYDKAEVLLADAVAVEMPA